MTTASSVRPTPLGSLRDPSPGTQRVRQGSRTRDSERTAVLEASGDQRGLELLATTYCASRGQEHKPLHRCGN